MIRRDRAESQSPRATRSPPTSDPRGTRAEGTEPFAHRHRGVFGASSAPGDQPDEYDPHHPPAEQRTNPQRDNHAHTRQPATTTTPPETPATTLHHPAKHGEEPSTHFETPPPGGRDRASPSEAPAGWARRRSTGSNRWGSNSSQTAPHPRTHANPLTRAPSDTTKAIRPPQHHPAHCTNHTPN